MVVSTTACVARPSRAHDRSLSTRPARSPREDRVSLESRVMASGTDEVLARAARMGRYSEQGLAHAIGMAAATRGLEAVVARNVRTVPGRGILGSAKGQAGSGREQRFNERPRMDVSARPGGTCA